MSCGACNPRAFQPERGGLVWGYVAAPDATTIAYKIQKLYFVGARMVMFDEAKGRVFDRPSLARLRLKMAKGDTLILSDMRSLGQKRERQDQNLATLQGDGLRVFTLRPDSDIFLSP